MERLDVERRLTRRLCWGRLVLVLVLVVSGLAVVDCRRKPVGPEAVAEPIQGGPYPTLLLSQAWFWKDAEGKQRPGPARLQIWRQTPAGWQVSRLEDAESNVFHKAELRDGAILTIGAEQAILRRWRFDSGRWTSERLWQRRWDGTFNRLRDFEIGDVDGDGKDEYVIATHDMGVVAVIDPAEGAGEAKVVELDAKPDTFVHEIEIGDLDGDGKREFVATPSARNKGNDSQPGELVLYRHDGGGYRRILVDSFSGTHAKEILLADVDRDGKDELFVALEGELRDGRLVQPVEIRQYHLRGDGSFSHEIIAKLEDRQTRFLLAADFDGDGRKELVAAAMRAGVFLLRQARAGGERGWGVECLDNQSSGYEHAALAADLDSDGTPELYVAADDQGELDRYVWSRESSSFRKTRLGSLDKSGFTWNIAAGRL